MSEMPSAEQMLQNAAWLKRLATTLANDKDDADDLVQESWIAVWRRQPDGSRPLRPWLAKVVRDLAGMKRRSDRRRAAREAVADDAQAPAAPDELIEQMRLHRVLVDLVLELDEPYRSTIIARFVEGRTSVSIARALGIPAGTVRKRLREALSRLRAGLDAKSGDRKRWAPAVLAFGKGVSAMAPASKMTSIVIAALVLLLLIVGVSIYVVSRHEGTASVAANPVLASASPDHRSGVSTTAPTNDPRAALRRRFPASRRPVLPAMLPPGSFALGPASTDASASSTSTPPLGAPKLVEFEFRAAPFVELVRVFGNQLETPIWVAYDSDAKIDINTHGQRPAIDVFDEVLESAGANRAEVAAIRIVTGGRTDAGTLGGEPVSLSFRNTPLNFVLDALEPRLGMPIGRFGPQAIPGTRDMDGNPIVEQSPPITLELHDVAAGAALEQALIQAGVGYQLTTGFVILPD